MTLLDGLVLGPVRSRNRVVFGPHETNLGRRRSISDRHVAYYRRRAAGGAGVIVVEEASVHPSDWPYERAPLASDCASGWAAVADACHAEGALVFAALGHAGGQGSSAYSQAPLWAPSRVPDVATREVPKWMEPADIDAVVGGFAEAAALAVSAGVDGIEINAGQYSLVRQFLSGLTNHRSDEWGEDKARLLHEVIAAVRHVCGATVAVGARLSCDELAPWAGITPEAAVVVAQRAAPLLDWITVVRGSIYTASATRPDGHTEPGFNLQLAKTVRDALGGVSAVIAQGSIVDPSMAMRAIDEGAADGVEMTRAQIADPDLVAKIRDGRPSQVKPCLLCNQNCQVRDNRNPIVSCVVEPSAGYETEDPAVRSAQALPPLDLLVVGAGVAGLECARVAALGGHRVTVLESSESVGGMIKVAANGAGRDRLELLGDWLASECERLGVTVKTGTRVTAADVAAWKGPVVMCTGSRPGLRGYAVDRDACVLDAAVALDGSPLPDGIVAVWDPIGGPVAVSVAELLVSEGRQVLLLTPTYW